MDTIRGIRTSAACVVLAAVMLIAACGGDDDGASTNSTAPASTQKGAYAGKLEESSAYIALVTDGKQVSGYVCDCARVSRWFKPTQLEYGKTELVARNGDPLGSVTIEGDQATGRVTVAGAERDFSAGKATGTAGLYRASDGKGQAEAGWIVLADGTQRGALNIKDGTSNTVKGTTTLSFGDGSVRFRRTVRVLKPKTLRKATFQDLHKVAFQDVH